MKALRRLLVFVVVIGVLYTVVEMVGTGIAEDRIGSVVQREFKLPSKPRVSVSGFPVVLRALLWGDVSEVAFEASDLTIEGLKVRSARARFEGLHADSLLNARTLAVRVGDGTLSADIGEAALTAYLRRRDVDATVRLREGKAIATVVRTFFGARRTIVGTGSVSLDGNRIVFEPASVTVDGQPVSGASETEAKRRARFSVTIPELPGGVRAERIELHKGFARLVARVEGEELSFG